MAVDLLAQMPQMAVTSGQQLVFSFAEKKILSLTVKDMEGMLGILTLKMVECFEEP